MKARVLVGAVLAAAGIATDAGAWEAFCRDPSAGKNLPLPGGGQKELVRYENRGVEDSICADPSALECSDGLAGARGWLMGEHRYITETALRMVGLGLPDDENQTPILGRPMSTTDTRLFDYWVDGETVDDTGPGKSFHRVAPAGPAGMKQHVTDVPLTYAAVTREPWLAELSEVPDTSYSLADYILGNETCLPPNALLRYQGSRDGITLPETTPLTDREQINACHAFRSHMGSVNSTHFGTQAAAMWFLHHRIALAIAQRCGDMWRAASAKDVSVAMREHFRTRVVPACEREAMAFEMVGAHYMEDLWSSGHMWERWGSPNFDPTLLGQLRQSVTGAVAGLEHGWRYVAQRFTQGLRWYSDATWWVIEATNAEDAQHDQLGLPGPPQRTTFTHPLTWFGPQDDLTVKYGFLDPGTNRTPVLAAGGDLYLLSCNALPANNPKWAVAGSSTAVPIVGGVGVGGDAPKDAVANDLRFQFQRMTTCLAYSFKEVYDAGPGPDEAYRPKQPAEIGPFDPSITAAQRAGKFPTTFPDDAVAVGPGGDDLFHRCLGQRVTNHSMVLGSGITDWGNFDSILSRAKVSVALLPGKAADAAALGTWSGKPRKGKRDDDSALDVVKSQLATDLGQFSMLLAQNDAADRDGLASARGLWSAQGNLTASFLKQPSNAAGAREILDEKVAYLEQRDPAKWSAHPADDATACSDDTFCPTHFPGTYCERTHHYDALPAPGTGTFGDVGTPVGRCMPLEAAELRAFRPAEVPYWCANDTVADLETARASCQHALVAANIVPLGAVGTDKLPACDACVQVVLPHLRASCHAPGYARAQDTAQRRSMCDVLKDGGVASLKTVDLDATSVYVPYDPASRAEAERAARFVCSVSTKVPIDARPPAATPAASFFRAGGGSACFTTCDACTTCIEPRTGSVGQLIYGDVAGPFDVGPDPAHVPVLTFDIAATSAKALLFGAESDIVDIALGLYATCAVRPDKTVWCAGRNDVGQLGIGDPSVASSIVPRKVKGLSGIAHVWLAGDSTFCATTDGGTSTSCWGNNDDARVGDGTTTARFEPVPIAIGGAVAEIVGSALHACARTTAAAMVCWGGTSKIPGRIYRTPMTVPGVHADAFGGDDVYLDGGAVKAWIDDEIAPVGCSNSVPIEVGGFAADEIGSDRSSNFCLRAKKDGATTCFGGYLPELPRTPPANCLAGYQATPKEVPFEVDALVNANAAIPAASRSLYARRGNSLYVLGTTSMLPVVSASEGAPTCH